MIETINPATGESIRRHPVMGPKDVAAVAGVTGKAASQWGRVPVGDRAQLVGRLAGVLGDRGEEYARLMTLEMGKPVGQARAEVEKCAWVCEYYAENASRFLAGSTVDTDMTESFVAFSPLGVVLAVMPWNFPFWQAIRFAAPAVAAGNGVLLKHAPNTTGCGLALEALFDHAGFPVDLVRAVIVSNEDVHGLIAHRAVRAVTFTGSPAGGRAVAATAGNQLKKTVLELGGSDPYLVLADADLDVAAGACVASRLINSGQSCVAAKRFIVDRTVAEGFLERVIEGMSQAVVGDPMADETTVGPLAREDLRATLHDQVQRSVAGGAGCPLGGQVDLGPGWFYHPTVLTDVAPGMPAYDEELFGPVAVIITAEDADDAVRIANDSVYGLGAAVFSNDTARARQIATDALEAGVCAVNTFVRSDPRLPFGGVKDSGYGRELSEFGIREFVNVKSVSVS
jgi:succinate-semialdehyde dehydrogenase/glutarate-semialdehyde dehydrogenase